MHRSEYKITDINNIINGDSVLNNDKSNIKHLFIDSRNATSPENSLFFAIRGERHDGHDYIEELYEKDIRNFVVSQFSKNIEDYPEANFIQVENTLHAFQTFCAYHRKQFMIPVVGITGSNGKTIVKEWIYQLLSPDRYIVRSPKSYNSQVGVPLSVWQIKPEHEIGGFEAGISQPDDMENLQKIILPTIGIITNIGEAHNEGFADHHQKTKEKLKLFSGAEALIYCRDYSIITDCLKESGINDLINHANVFTWSRKTDANLLITNVQSDDVETEIIGRFKEEVMNIIIPFTDDASIENAIHCWAFMLLKGYSKALIAERMLSLTPVAMRLELKEGINNCTIINDSYNSDIGSLEIALDFMNQQKQEKKKTVILSDILQSGKDEQNLYNEVSGLLKEKGVDRLIGIGEATLRNEEIFSTGGSFFSSTEDFLNKYSNTLFQNEIILIKGARPFRLDRKSVV